MLTIVHNLTDLEVKADRRVVSESVRWLQVIETRGYSSYSAVNLVISCHCLLSPNTHCTALMPRLLLLLLLLSVQWFNWSTPVDLWFCTFALCRPHAVLSAQFSRVIVWYRVDHINWTLINCRKLHRNAFVMTMPFAVEFKLKNWWSGKHKHNIKQIKHRLTERN